MASSSHNNSAASPPRSVFHSFASLRSPSSRSGVGGAATPYSVGNLYSRSATSMPVDGDSVGGGGGGALDGLLDDDEAYDATATAALYGPNGASPSRGGRLTPSVGSALYTAQKAQNKKELMSYYDVDPVAVLQRLKAASASNGRRSDAQSSISSTWHEPSIHEPIIESNRGKLLAAHDRKSAYDPLDADEVAPSQMSFRVASTLAATGRVGRSATVGAGGGGGGRAGSPANKYYIERSSSELYGMGAHGDGGAGGRATSGSVAAGAAFTEVDYSTLPTPSWLSPHQPLRANPLPSRPLPFENVLSRNDVILYTDEAEEARAAADQYILSCGAAMVASPPFRDDEYRHRGGGGGHNAGAAAEDPQLAAARAALGMGAGNAAAGGGGEPLPNDGDLALDLDAQQQDDLNLDLEDPVVARARVLADNRKALEELRWRASAAQHRPPPITATTAVASPTAAAGKKGAASASPLFVGSPSAPTSAYDVNSPLSHFGNAPQPAAPRKIEMVASPTAAAAPAAPTGPKGAKAQPPALATGAKKAVPPAPASPTGARGVKGVAPAAAASPPPAAEPAEQKAVVFIPPVPSVERPTLKQLEERAASLAYNPASYQDYLFEKYLQESHNSPASPMGRGGGADPSGGGEPASPLGSPSRGLLRAQQQQDVLAKTQLTAVLHDPLRTGKFYDPFYSFKWWELGSDNDEVLKRGGGVATAGPHPDSGVMMFADRFNNLTFGPYALHPMRLWMVDYLAEKVADLDDPVLRKIDTLLVNNLGALWEVEKMLVTKYGVPNSYATAPPSLKYDVVYPPESNIEFVPLSEAMSRDMLARQKEIEDEEARVLSESKNRSSKSAASDGDSSDGSPLASPRSGAASPSSPSPTSKKGKKAEEPPASPTGKDKKGKKEKEEAKDDGKKDKSDKKEKKDKGGDDKKEKSDKKEKKDKGGDDKKEKSDKKEKKDKGGDDGKKDKGDKKEKKDKKK